MQFGQGKIVGHKKDSSSVQVEHVYDILQDKNQSSTYLPVVADFFTARKRSLGQGNIYRPQRSCGQGNVFTGVCLSTGGGGCLPQCMLGCHTPPGMENPPWMENPPRWRTPPMENPLPPRWRNPPRMEKRPPREADSSIWSTSGRYASYWNAFLFHKRLSFFLSTGGGGVVASQHDYSSHNQGGSASRGICIQGEGVCLQGGLPPGRGLHPGGVGRPPQALRDTVNKREVRILLECILVFTLVRITSRWPLMATFRLIFLTNLHKNGSKHLAVDLQLRLFAGDAIILIDGVRVKLDKPPCSAQIDNHEVRPF